MVDLKAKPFYLDERAVQWVETTLNNMSLDEKLGQVFIQLAHPDKDYLDEKILGKHVGGILFRQNEAKVVQETLRYIQKSSKIPVLFCGNLEEGGIGLAKEGTYFSKQMETIATGNTDFAYQNGRVLAREASALGCHMSFGPVVDMTIDWRSAITSTNTYGADADQVLKYASANMQGQMDNGLVTAVKHFPGEGADDHDQHYNCEINEMSIAEWDNVFGKVFQGLIDQGTMSIMPGHIALPSYQKYYADDMSGQVMPATYSKALLTNLLREKLGFNGLIVSDNTCIAGASNYLPRYQAVPQMLMAGIDLILYSFDMDEDLDYLKAALQDGRLTMERLNEAVTRNLAVKASLGLHDKQKEGTLVPDEAALDVLGCVEHRDLARRCASDAVTLVKNGQNLLPLNTKEHQKILLTVISDPWEREHIETLVKKQLEEAGFTVTVSNPNDSIPKDNSVRNWQRKYDLFLYISHQESARKDKLSLRINWHQAGNLPRFSADIPTVHISFGNPFELYDLPNIKTYINAYCLTDIVVEETLKKVLGQSDFKGISPVDPFCGKDYLRY